MINYTKALYNKWGENIIVRLIANTVSTHWRNKVFKGTQFEPILYSDHSIDLGQATHPDVVYDDSNRRYLMTVSNYPYGIERLEDSYVLVSYDGIHFRNVTKGPVERYGRFGNSHFSDGDLICDDHLYSLYYRFCERDEREPKDIIRICTSLDGVNWNKSQTIITAPKNHIVSPAVVYDNGQYIMYYVMLGEAESFLCRHSSFSRDFQDCSSIGEVVKIENVPAGMILWHINVSLYENRLYGLFTFSVDCGGADARLYYAEYIRQRDTWVVKKMINPFKDMKHIKKVYRSALVRVQDRWYLYLTICLKNNCWFIGRCEFEDIQ